jgi:hypothetical protein
LDGKKVRGRHNTLGIGELLCTECEAHLHLFDKEWDERKGGDQEQLKDFPISVKGRLPSDVKQGQAEEKKR